MSITKHNRQNRARNNQPSENEDLPKDLSHLTPAQLKTAHKYKQLWNELDHGPSPWNLSEIAITIALFLLFTAVIWLPPLVGWIKYFINTHNI